MSVWQHLREPVVESQQDGWDNDKKNNEAANAANQGSLRSRRDFGIRIILLQRKNEWENVPRTRGLDIRLDGQTS